MAGLLNIPKFVDYRKKVKRHSHLKFPVLNLKNKTTIAIHHSLTRRGLAGSNAESYARYHVETHGCPSIGYIQLCTVHLPASAKTWRTTYKLNVQPIKKNSDWSLTPVAFGGLTYEDPRKPYPNVVTINTSRGKRNIYVGPETGAVIK